MNVPKSLDKYQKLIIGDMKSFLKDKEYDHQKMIQYHLGWLDREFNPVNLSSGKLSRPSILLMTTEALGGKIENALPAATAIQIFHDFTLMHDDIEDGDPLRRHRETVWNLWEIPRAINAGDAMYTYSLQCLLRLKSHRDEVLEYLLSVYQGIVTGQELDLSSMYKKTTDVSLDDYIKMVGGKSAMLIGASAKVGAIMADADHEVAEHFYAFGYNMGIAYQVYDDIVSIWGNMQNSGKVEHMDIIDKKKTLPVLMLFELADQNDLNVLNEIYNENKIEHAGVVKILELMDKYHIKEKSQADLKKYKDASRSAIDKLGLSNEKADEFVAILDWLIPESSL